MTERILTPEAEADRAEFEALFGRDGNCACHLVAPCGSCTHPGNPVNQEEDDEYWQPEPAEDPGLDETLHREANCNGYYSMVASGRLG